MTSAEHSTGAARRWHPSSPLPLSGDVTSPWLGAAFVLGVVNLAVVVQANDSAMLGQAVMLTGLCGTIAAAGLVSSRSHRADDLNLREERARPAAEELTHSSAAVGSASYLEGMGRWTGAMLELFEHAISETDPATLVHEELAAAAEETRDLHDLLDVESGDMLTINDQAKLHALGSLWETSQIRLEQLAAEVDASWHRRWQARNVVERRLRHGRDLPRALVLPYGG